MRVEEPKMNTAPFNPLTIQHSTSIPRLYSQNKRGTLSGYLQKFQEEFFVLFHFPRISAIQQILHTMNFGYFLHFSDLVV